MARAANDTDATMMSLQSLGLALAGTGRYTEAIEMFEETLRFGREYGIGPFLARGVAVSVGFHLDVFDLDGHERIAQEARELARSLSFPPALASTGSTCCSTMPVVVSRGGLRGSRRGQCGGGAYGFVARLAVEGPTGGGSRGPRACPDEWESAVMLAQAAVEHSRASGRRKYEALGQVTNGRALVALGRGSEAVAAFREAVRVSRGVGDPASSSAPPARCSMLMAMTPWLVKSVTPRSGWRRRSPTICARDSSVRSPFAGWGVRHPFPARGEGVEIRGLLGDWGGRLHVEPDEPACLSARE